jgi:hypothetical protein
VAKSIVEELSDVVEAVADKASRGLDDVKAYLSTPEGQALRRRIAQAALVAAPLMFRMKFFTRTKMGRLIGLAGGAALVVKLAEALRDWEPHLPEPLSSD